MDGLMYHKGLARGAAACCMQTHEMVKGKLVFLLLAKGGQYTMNEAWEEKLSCARCGE
jgi:hypothetical protein